MSYVTVTLAVFGIFAMMILLRNWRQSIISRHRMYRMMLACGIDPTTASHPDQLLDIDMQDARKRCRRCPAPDLCDRWLNGETLPGNDFCPNAARFMDTLETGRCRVRYEMARRPGRRLDN